MNREHAKALIEKHEGNKTTVYLDSTGNRTIGVGCNLERADAQARIEKLGIDFARLLEGAVALTPEQVRVLFDEDFNMAVSYAKRYLWDFEVHPYEVQSVIVDMTFNLDGRFANFTKAIAAFDELDYGAASREMQDSLWFQQTGNRGREDVAIVQAHATLND